MKPIMTQQNSQNLLAIETSCDDTCAAVTQGWQILSNVIKAQDHSEYGGVFPTHAKHEHQADLPTVVDQALSDANMNWSQIDVIAVTQGPGLAPSLEQGIAYAKELAATHQKPLIPVNHIEGHVWSVWGQLAVDGDWLSVTNNQNQDFDQQPGNPNHTPHPSNPTLSLIVSGGHTDFILVKGIGKYQRLGWTIDDAAGEALDKFGRELGLRYPAGPEIERLAKSGDADAYNFPLPMTTRKDFLLSFAGLKTAGKNMIKEERLKVKDYFKTNIDASNDERLTINHNSQIPHLTPQVTANLCASFQYAVFRHITYKLNKILDAHPEITEIWLGGGVAANHTLRRMIQNVTGFPLRTPASINLCRDNAAMIGLVGQFKEAVSAFERKPEWAVD